MKNPAKNRIRLAASAAALAVLALGATGCGAINDQATTIHYDASDGVSVWSDALQGRNLLLVTNGADQQARFIGQVSNPTTKKATFTIAFNGKNISLPVEPQSSVNLQDAKYAEQFTVPGMDEGKNKTTNPGLAVTTSMTPGDDTAQDIDVPVVNGTLKDYAAFVPGGSDKDARKHLEPATAEGAEH
ncbi:hypothetical protein [Galactobacter caseinivorans]|uniref:DNA modification methylase n=1 Tax=Galactobacter caseinivorans TaxID=2676123 RepID=A0A496PH53_9MICC|nr:hypothetical protein [Galactobacter caseinivorans]RKW69813.1 hypothetical protein DWQ67_10020 [Galactobacter caseinivorans]